MHSPISLLLAPLFGGWEMPDSQTSEPRTYRPLIIANWKMNGSRSSIAALAEHIILGVQSLSVEVVICPPALFIADVAGCIKDMASPAYVQPVEIGAQNVCEYGDGAYTGEVSGSMLREFGCRYVIIGHSERRQYYHESDEQVASKLVAAQQAGLLPVLCVGETAAQHERGETKHVVQGQLKAIIDQVGLEALAAAVIAYEPIWAIGTGKVATAEAAQQVLSDVRAQLSAPGEHTRLLYGGSVTTENAEQLFRQQDINGALVGGASLDADQFVQICKIAGLN